MNPEMEEFSIEKVSKRKESGLNKLQFKFNNWLVSKGWIYIMVFFMGMLTGGLIWK